MRGKTGIRPLGIVGACLGSSGPRPLFEAKFDPSESVETRRDPSRARARAPVLGIRHPSQSVAICRDLSGPGPEPRFWAFGARRNLSNPSGFVGGPGLDPAPLSLKRNQIYPEQVIWLETLVFLRLRLPGAGSRPGPPTNFDGLRQISTGGEWAPTILIPTGAECPKSGLGSGPRQIPTSFDRFRRVKFGLKRGSRLRGPEACRRTGEQGRLPDSPQPPPTSPNLPQPPPTLPDEGLLRL